MCYPLKFLAAVRGALRNLEKPAQVTAEKAAVTVVAGHNNIIPAKKPRLANEQASGKGTEP